jgi:FtsP/CotA-like multicopper oxidase with cupredoxin domain
VRQSDSVCPRVLLTAEAGQRYDVVVTADQSSVADDFWMRAIPQEACSENDSSDNIKAVVYYGDSAGTPSTTGYSYMDSCDDMDLRNLVPYLSKTVESEDFQGEEAASVGYNDDDVFRWYLNSTTMVTDWADPTLLQIYDNQTTWSTSNAVIELTQANEWVYIVVETTFSVPHPIHLHGHDFYILAQDTGTYSSSVTLNTANPPRRDTAMLPASGYLAIAFQANNPGAWLMHCHIGWHTSEGFALQFVEQYDVIQSLLDSDTLTDSCDAWESHVSQSSIEQDDSGI